MRDSEFPGRTRSDRNDEPGLASVITCGSCGARILAAAEICPKCGVRQHGQPPAVGSAGAHPAPYAAPASSSDRRIVPAALLCGLLGVFGAHRFYVGRKGTAVVQLLTLGGLGIWMLVDLIMILTEQFKDDRGRPLTEWV